jgi:hypothetical protein
MSDQPLRTALETLVLAAECALAYHEAPCDPDAVNVDRPLATAIRRARAALQGAEGEAPPVDEAKR